MTCNYSLKFTRYSSDLYNYCTCFRLQCAFSPLPEHGVIRVWSSPPNCSVCYHPVVCLGFPIFNFYQNGYKPRYRTLHLKFVLIGLYGNFAPANLSSPSFFHLCAIVLSTSISPTERAYRWDYLITWSIRRRVSEKSFVICPKRVLFRLVAMEIRWRDMSRNERVCKINTASDRYFPDNKLPPDSASDWGIGAWGLFFSILHCWIVASSNSINNMSTALIITALKTFQFPDEISCNLMPVLHLLPSPFKQKV